VGEVGQGVAQMVRRKRSGIGGLPRNEKRASPDAQAIKRGDRSACPGSSSSAYRRRRRPRWRSGRAPRPGRKEHERRAFICRTNSTACPRHRTFPVLDRARLWRRPARAQLPHRPRWNQPGSPASKPDAAARHPRRLVHPQVRQDRPPLPHHPDPGWDPHHHRRRSPASRPPGSPRRDPRPISCD
jgi:hypothetical protein